MYALDAKRERGGLEADLAAQKDGRGAGEKKRIHDKRPQRKGGRPKLETGSTPGETVLLL